MYLVPLVQFMIRTSGRVNVFLKIKFLLQTYSIYGKERHVCTRLDQPAASLWRGHVLSYEIREDPANAQSHRCVAPPSTMRDPRNLSNLVKIQVKFSRHNMKIWYENVIWLGKISLVLALCETQLRSVRLLFFFAISIKFKRFGGDNSS